MPETPDTQQREIRSFVIRSGRMTDSQRQAFQQHMKKWSLSANGATFNGEEIFGNKQPVILEIGFGMGDSLAEMASAMPDNNFLGIEVHQAGVGRLLRLVNEKALDNVRVYCHDAVQILKNKIPDNTLERVNIYFPDPWHKRKHLKRRLIQNDFLTLLHSKLKSQGLLHIATDWKPYAEHTIKTIALNSYFENVAQNELFINPLSYGRPKTKFEQRGLKLGHGVWDMVFKNRP